MIGCNFTESSESMDVEKQASRDGRENRGDVFVDDMASTDTMQESSRPSPSTNIVMDTEDLDMVCENENNDDENDDDEDDDNDEDNGNESDVHDNEKDVNKFCCTQNVFDAACESPMGIRESNRSPINLQEELGLESESDSLSESENMDDTSHKDLGAADELGLEKRVDSWLNEADKNSDVFNQSVSSEDNFVPVGIIDIRKRQENVSQSAFDQSNNDLSPSPCSRQGVLSPQSDRPVSQCCNVAADPTEIPGHTEDKGYDESKNLMREEEKEKHGPKVAEIVHEDKTLKSVEVRKTDNNHEVKTKSVDESTPSTPSLKLKIKLSGHTTVCSVGGLEEATEQTFEKAGTGKSGLKFNSDTSGREEKDMEEGKESDKDGEGKESDEDGEAKESDEDGEEKESDEDGEENKSDEDGEEKESDKDGKGKEQENTGNIHGGIQDPSGNIEDPKWLEDLIDSSSTDSDSDIGSDPRSVPLSVSSVGEVCEVSTCAPAQKDTTAHTNTDAYSRSESETQSDVGKQLVGAVHKSGSLPCATKSSSFEANRPPGKEEQEKLRFSYVPARSAAVKALNKMKTDDTEEDEDGGGTGDSTRNKKSIGKAKSFKSSSVPSKSGSSSNVNRSFSHGKPSMSEASRQPGPRKPSNSYMCRYCIDISEGPLRKIKPHVLTKHSSMPPMVINCVKQRHHIRCRFYICPRHACYNLSETEEEFEAHKATHSGVSTEVRKRKERTTLNSLSSTENRKKFSVSSENITDPSKRSLQMENIASCRVELDMLNADILKSNGTVHLRQEKKYQCLYCTEYYYDKLLSGMKSHYAKEHEAQLMVMRDTEARKAQLPSRIYVCDRPNCECFYLNRSDLDSHAKSHKSNFTYFYECACCGWYSSSYSAANIHLSTEHGDEQSASLIQMQVSVDEYGQTSKRVL